MGLCTSPGLVCSLRGLAGWAGASEPQLPFESWETLGPTYCGLSHCLVLNLTPVPQVREQEPKGLQEPQLPSRLRMSGVSQMQCPLKQC